MATFAAALLLLALPTQEDLPKRVSALVERLGAEELEERERAGAELAKLGAPAVEAIKAHLGKSAGEIRRRLDDILRRIDRTIRCDALLGPIVTINLKAEKRPLPEVLDELKRQGGQPIEWKDLPADPVTVSFDKAGFWQALDEICKAHGGVMWRGEPTRILVERAPYRDLPKAYDRNFVFYLTKYEEDLSVGRRGPSRHYNFHGGVAWTRGSAPASARIRLDEVKDDRGTDLLAERTPNLPWSVKDISGEIPGLIQADVYQGHRGLTHLEATRLEVCRGAILLHVILETKNVLTLENPEKPGARQLEGEGVGGWLQDFKVADGKVKSTLCLQLKGGQKKDFIRPNHFAVRDFEGKLHPARGHAGAFSEAGAAGVPEVWYHLEWDLPPKSVIAALELHVPTDMHELAIEFNFKNLPLK